MDRDAITCPEPRKELLVSVRLPFCPYACPICTHGPLLQASPQGKARYVDALCREVRASSADYDWYEVSSIEFTGGLTTAIAPQDVVRILREVRSALHVAPDAQVIMRSVGGGLNLGNLGEYLNAHVTGIELERYTAMPTELEGLGTPECTQSVLESATVLQQGGYRGSLAVSCYYDAPGQTEITLVKTLGEACNLGCDMIWLLPYPNAGAAGEAHVPEKARSYLAGRGYEPCEVAPGMRLATESDSAALFARPGKQWRHTMADATLVDVAGFGLGARSRLGGVTYHNTLDADLYLAHSDNVSKIAVLDRSHTYKDAPDNAAGAPGSAEA